MTRTKLERSVVQSSLGLPFVVITILAAACSNGPSGPGSDDADDGTSDDGAPDDDGPANPGGSCVGNTLECYKLTSISSCFREHGCFQTGEDCTGKQVDCELASDKAYCLDLFGCTWHNEDGTTESLQAGTCSGAALVCDTITDETTCTSQASACLWDDETSTCDRDFSVAADCGDIDRRVIFPDEKQRICEDRSGCTWTPG